MEYEPDGGNKPPDLVDSDTEPDANADERSQETESDDREEDEDTSMDPVERWNWLYGERTVEKHADARKEMKKAWNSSKHKGEVRDSRAQRRKIKKRAAAEREANDSQTLIRCANVWQSTKESNATATKQNATKTTERTAWKQDCSKLYFF